MLQALDAYAKAVAEAPDADTAFRLAERAAADLIGHRLFTVMALHRESMEVERCYSSNPDKYPTGGRKKKRFTAWGDQVLTQGRPFIGYNADDIRANFNDYAVIIDLGLESVLNMPIRADGKTLGTMNLLDEAGFYREDHVACAHKIADELASALKNR
ncbi:GAF domain-containing protein [Thalassospiraceae bacterium LMO-JJ14]|nr:GAF domain-containing protein [Thalassospiraceae bacterium LMO-JJ14]